MYNLIPFYLVSLFFFGSVRAQEVDIPGQYQWKNRILIVFAKSEKSANYQKQLQKFEKQREALIERDMIIFSVFDKKIITPEKEISSAASAEHLRQQYNISGSGLSVVLVGKDGGEKLTQHDFIPTEKLFELIDQMPMRRREMTDKEPD